MALLERSQREWASSARVFGVFCLLMLAGCVILDSLRGEDSFGFSHRIHIEDEGLECLDCHIDAEDADDPGIPNRRQCMLCHEDIDEEKPPEERIDVLFVDGKYAPTRVSALEDEVIFSHVEHVNAEEDCGSCHVGIETNDAIRELDPVSMDDCMACHARGYAANECSTCHSQIGEDWEPDSHHQNWMRVHGQSVRGYSGDRVDDCGLCHRESDCISCHLETPPANHTNYWRQRGHGVFSSIDRRSCATCHRSDFCNRCHEDAIPMSHNGMWGNPRDTHCLSCHEPLRSTSCITCHKSTPSHERATPLPPDHNPGLNCRQCHGVTAALPHVDNGDECILCHR